jgi:hypothetical protein
MALQLGDLGNLSGGSLSFWIPTVIAALGIILSIYFYRRSRRFKRVAYLVTTRNLIQDYSAKLADLKIEFKGKSPRSISVSKIGIWSDGSETIHGSDTAQADPLRLRLNNAELLDAKIVSITLPASQFSIATDGDNTLVGFDFLDKNQGGIVQLIHTGTSSKNIELSGSVKGASSLVRRSIDEDDKTLASLTQGYAGVAVGAVFLFYIAAFLVSFLSPSTFVEIASRTVEAFGILSILVVLGRLTAFSKSIPKPFKPAKEIV